MRQNYQMHYKAEVESLADKGFELYLLSGRALRSRVELDEQHDERYMSVELQEALKSSCHDSLSLSEFSAEKLAGRIIGSKKSSVASRESKASSKVD